MSDLDFKSRDSEVSMSENMIQYAFNKYNQSHNLMESIKSTPVIYKKVKEATLEYQEQKNNRKETPQTPIVTAQDIRDEMYR